MRLVLLGDTDKRVAQGMRLKDFSQVFTAETEERGGVVST